MKLSPQQHQILQLLGQLGSTKLSELRAHPENPYNSTKEALIDVLNRLRIKGLVTKKKRGYYQTTQTGKEIAQIEYEEIQTKIKELTVRTKVNQITHTKLEVNLQLKIERVLTSCLTTNGTMRSEGQNLLDELEFVSKKREEYQERLKEAKENIEELSRIGLKDLILYAKRYAGYSCTLDIYPFAEVLLTLATIPAVNNVRIETPDKILNSRINIANAGDQNSGKSFVTRNLLCGSADPKVEPCGIPFIRDGIEDVTGPSFIFRSYIEEHSGYNFIYLNDEYTKWLRLSPELKTLQKRIFEGEKIRWALKSGISVPEYHFKGCFIVNFNINYDKSKGILSFDSDIRAILSRLILRAYVYDDKVHEFYQDRHLKMDEQEAWKIRLFLCLLYEIASNRSAIDGYPNPNISWPEEDYERVKSIGNEYVTFLKEVGNLNTIRLNFGTRQIDNAIKIGSNLTILDYFTQLKSLVDEKEDIPKNTVVLEPPEEAVQLAMNYLLDELIVRQPKPSMLQNGSLNEVIDFGSLFKKLRKLNLKRWSELSA